MKKHLIGQIIDIFKAKLDWTVYYFESNSDINHGNHDGQLQINTDGGTIQFVSEIKKSVVPSSIATIKQTVKETNKTALNAQGTILLANYISTKARELLVENKINFADTGGNMYLKFKDIHIHIDTGQSDRSALSKDIGRAFTKTGLKVVYQFFRTNQIVHLNDTYRKIAEESDVSKDTVAKVIIDLLAKGYILRLGKNQFKWRAKKELFEHWVQSYNQVIRPNLASQRFKFVVEPENDSESPPGYQISGYNAANWHYEIPPDKQIINPNYIFYSHLPLRDAVKNLQLIPTDKGNVTIYEAFWKNESDAFVAVDAIVIYADLTHTNDPRYLDIATLIYQRYFHDKL